MSLGLVGCGGIQSVDGPTIYASQCARCHGGDGQGSTGPALGSNSRMAELSDDEIESVIVNGRRAMPRYGGLSEVQLENLVAYLRTLP